MRRGGDTRPIERAAVPESTPSGMTLADIRITAPPAVAERIAQAIIGALGDPEENSKPYPNRGDDGKVRRYMKFIVPKE